MRMSISMMSHWCVSTKGNKADKWIGGFMDDWVLVQGKLKKQNSQKNLKGVF